MNKVGWKTVAVCASIFLIVVLIFVIICATESGNKPNSAPNQSNNQTVNASNPPYSTQTETLYPTTASSSADYNTQTVTADNSGYVNSNVEETVYQQDDTDLYQDTGSDTETNPESYSYTVEATATPTPTVAPTPTPYTYTGNDEFIVTFIDVDQGDAILIQDNGSVMMIDTGDKDYVDRIEDVLDQYGISYIDAILLTHPDADHIQGASNLIKDYKVDCVYMPNCDRDTGSYGYLMRTIDTYNVPVYHPDAGEMIPFGTASYEVLGPVREYEEINSYSIVLKVVHGNDSFLFTGDATGEETDDILAAGYDVSADVLKAAHHGSANDGCNNEAFWNAVDPEAVVISCGLHNDHGHPHGEVMDMIKKRECKLFRTDLQGNITCRSTGNGIVWDIEPSNDYRRGYDL